MRAEGEKKSLRSPLSRASVSEVTEEAVIVQISDEINAGILRDQAAIMERVFKDVLGTPLRLQVRVQAKKAGAPRSATPGTNPSVSGVDTGDGETDLLAYAVQKLTQPAE
jgi:hypothetical protein